MQQVAKHSFGFAVVCSGCEVEARAVYAHGADEAAMGQGLCETCHSQLKTSPRPKAKRKKGGVVDTSVTLGVGKSNEVEGESGEV